MHVIIGGMRVLLLVPLLLAGCHIDDDYRRGPWPGDFNDDGYADVAIGAPLDDDGTPASDRGRVYVFRGAGAVDTTADVVLSGAEAGARFGFSVAAIGDFNGDGRPDLAASAPLEDAGGTDRGRVYIYFGGGSFSAPFVISGTEDAGQFGFAIARAGDVNGDGRDDLIVGAPFEDAGGTDRGNAYLFFGGSSPSSMPALVFVGSEDNAHLGRAVSTAGDVNGDGYFDILIAEPQHDAGATDRGRVHLHIGGPGLDSAADLTFIGGEDAADFGWSIAGIFDTNLDGYDDVVVGAPNDDADGVSGDSGADIGRAFFYYGGPLMDASPDLTFVGTEAKSRFGEVVARIGDFNRGGAPDLLIGAPGDDADGDALDATTDRGRAFVYFGGPSMDILADAIYAGAEDKGEFGSSADSPGDFNGDGFRDVIIGSPLNDADLITTDSGADRGRAHLFYGATNPAMSGGVSFDGTEDDADFGRAVARGKREKYACRWPVARM